MYTFIHSLFVPWYFHAFFAIVFWKLDLRVISYDKINQFQIENVNKEHLSLWIHLLLGARPIASSKYLHLQKRNAIDDSMLLLDSKQISQHIINKQPAWHHSNNFIILRSLWKVACALYLNSGHGCFGKFASHTFTLTTTGNRMLCTDTQNHLKFCLI